MHLLAKSPCPDVITNAGEDRSSLSNDDCHCQPVVLKTHLKERILKGGQKFLGTAMKKQRT